MSFSFLGSLANLLPGYIEGQRQAVKDNWYDLNQYNQVQAGQIQNAFDEATFADKVRMVNSGAAMNDLSYMNKLWDTQLFGAKMPGMMQQAGLFNQFAGLDFLNDQTLKYLQTMMFPQMVRLGMMQTPNFTGGGTITTPSAVAGGK